MTFEEIENAQAELEAKKTELRAQAVKDSTEKILVAFDSILTPEELASAVYEGFRRRGMNCRIEVKSQKQAKPKAAPKYRNPADNSQTWTGKGKSPRWFDKSRAADFLIPA